MSQVKELAVPAIRVGVSLCLLGEKVRHDGGHKHNRYVTGVLGRWFEFVPVCPEVEVGMGVPRESVRLVGKPGSVRMVRIRSGEDWTDRVTGFAAKRAARSDLDDICGYIFKKDSPSCGIERVKLYSKDGMPQRKERGLWASAVAKRHPLLPIEDEGRLNDARLRDNFITRVFAYARLRRMFEGHWNRGQLVDFHARHKYLVLAHHPEGYKSLGRLVAAAKRHAPVALRDEYSRLFMEALSYKATAAKNTNVLLHMLGFLKRDLGSFEKQDLLEVIHNYRRGLVPLIVPLTLVKHYIEKHDVPYVRDQVYLNPHPQELMLRNHV